MEENRVLVELQEISERLKMIAQREFCRLNNLPIFARAYCDRCGNAWFRADGYEVVSLVQAATTHITACPYCGHSWCE